MIDIDVVYDDRPKIFEYIRKKFGQEYTARVAAYGTLVSKSIIDLVCRALNKGHEPKLYESSIIKEEFETDPDGTRQKYPEVFKYYNGLEGVKISQSVHPAGMVISPVNLVENYGVFQKDGESCLTLDMEEVHDTGLVKYDFLALKTVKVIRDTCRLIGTSYPKTNEINWDDPAVWDDFDKDQMCVFQFESGYSQECVKKFQPRNIFDMTIINACIRPSGASYRDDLLARKVHKNPSPLIDELLKDNYGYLIYQEDIILFLQNVCGLSGSEADTVRRGISRKHIEILEAMMPRILEGYCSKSSSSREQAEQEVQEFLRIIEDSSEYMFNKNHSIAYSLLSYLCVYYRHYYPLQFTTAFLMSAANDDDIKNGDKLMAKNRIRLMPPKFGHSRADYFMNVQNNTISKGISSLKGLGTKPPEQLYELSQQGEYKYFVDLLYDIRNKTVTDSSQLDTLIKVDYFSEFGNQRELLRIYDIFKLFKNGDATMIKKEKIAGSPLEDIVKENSIGINKDGKESKSYRKMNTMEILRQAEVYIKSLHMADLPMPVKAKNFNDAIGYPGYVTGKEEDRPILMVIKVYPLRRKSDDKQFGYSIITKSVGSGIESRFTIFNRVFDKQKIKAGDLIKCLQFRRDGGYYCLRSGCYASNYL